MPQIAHHFRTGPRGTFQIALMMVVKGLKAIRPRIKYARRQAIGSNKKRLPCVLGRSAQNRSKPECFHGIEDVQQSHSHMIARQETGWQAFKYNL